MIRYYLNIIRPINLLLTALTQLLFYISASRIHSGLSIIDFENIRYPESITSLLACLFIAAGGYVINDLFDIESDKINKPKRLIAGMHLSHKNLYIYYGILTALGIISGFITGLGMGILCIAISLLLYFYSSDFKGEYLVGNLLVSLLAGMVVYIASRGVFLVEKAYFAEYSVIAFCVTYARELVKDWEDQEGDSSVGHQTFAITRGLKPTKIFTWVHLGISIILLIAIGIHSQQLEYWLFSGLIVIPYSSWISWKLIHSSSKAEFTYVSQHLKYLMFIGLLTSLLC